MVNTDLGRVKQNVATMVQKGAPEPDIDKYISGEGTTVDAIKNWSDVPVKISQIDAAQPTVPSQLSRDAAIMQKMGAEDDGRHDVDEFLPLQKNKLTGKVSFTQPEFLRSAERGVGDLISTAQRKDTEATPDSVAAMTTFIPGFKPTAKAVTKGAEMVGGKALDIAGKTREMVNSKSDAMAKNATVEAKPLPESLLKGVGGKPLNINPKAMEGGRDILKTALQEDDINPLDVAQRLEEARATGLPITAADVISKEVGGVQTHGKNVLGLLKGAANMPGAGASMIGEMASRGQNTVKRLGNAFDMAFSKKGVYEVSDAALESMKTETPKAYKTAFEGGSIAPLEGQFAEHFRAGAEKISTAQKMVSEANQKLLQIEAKKQTNANVYVDSSLIAEKRKAIETMQKAEKELDAAYKQEQESKELLRQAQTDRKNGVKGAVWSPRIQEFLGDDTVQNGIKKGLWIAKKEAMANGEKFNPHEYGITGYDAAGEPIVSKVPNMRMLDAGKKGLDAIINESKNPLTGQMNETGRAVSMLKNAYLKEVDRLNPDYAKARKTYGDQASVLEALESGRDFMKMDKEEIARFMGDPETSAAEKSAFATGVRRALQERMDKARDGANPISQIWTQYMRDKLEPIFADKGVFDKFSKMMDYEQNMQYVNSQSSTGSQTNMLGNFQKQMTKPVKIYKAVTNPGGAAIDSAMGMVGNKMSAKAAGMDKDQAAIIARYLTTNDPQVWYDLAGRIQ